MIKILNDVGKDRESVFTATELKVDVSEAVSAIIEKAYKQAESMLKERMNELHSVANALLVREKITGDEFRAILEGQSLEDAVAGEETETAVEENKTEE